jgi:hypothetical protein
VFLQPCPDVSAAGGLQRGRCRVPGEQVSHGRMIQVRTKGPVPGPGTIRVMSSGVVSVYHRRSDR